MPESMKPTTWRVVLTVGTSLLSNKGGPGRDHELRDLNTDCDNLHEALKNNNAANTVCQRRDAVLKQLLDVVDEAYEVGLRSGSFARGREELDRLPQELSYLHILLRDWPCHSFPEIVLLSSDSCEGRVCAEIIKGFIEARKQGDAESPWDRVGDVRVKRIKGLQTKCRQNFEATGAPNLIKTIVGLANEVAGRDSACGGVVINPTGGFKALIPYATMASAFIDPNVYYKMHYLFAENAEIIGLPPYPIGLDFPLWHREENLRQASPKWAGYREALSFRMRAVAHDPETDATTAIFAKAYEDQLHTDPFQNFSAKVVHDLLKGNHCYRDRLLKVLSEVGPNIWLGDKVPMAADHAAHHHQHLMETAQLLLGPMLRADEDFLNDEERFVLLAGMLLHDCGHTVDALPDAKTGKLVRLFPSEVRDLHNFLSRYRLTDEKHAAALEWDPKACLAEEVAWLCVYHRAHTGWDKIEDTFKHGYCPYMEEHIASPVEAAAKYGLDTRIDFPKLVALLRLIDGCDNQTRRVGALPRTKALEQGFDLDREVFVEQLRNAVMSALIYADRQPCRPGMDFINKCAAWLDTSDKLPEFCQNTRQNLAVTSEDQVWARLWTDAARARDEIALRDRQLFHFVKHQVVRRVLIHPADDFCADGTWSFQVTLLEDSDFELDGYQDVLDNKDFADMFGCTPTLRVCLLHELAKEIGDPKTGDSPQLRHIAEQSGKALSFKFAWEDAPTQSVVIGLAAAKKDRERGRSSLTEEEAAVRGENGIAE